MSLPDILGECARIAAGSSGAGAGALASVAKRHGSLPMSATAKMLVTAGGARIGTVGGGCLEAEIVERAHDVLQHRAPALSTHSLNAELAGDYGLTCGGTAELFIEPVYADDCLAAVYAEAAALMARGERALMVTGVYWNGGVMKAIESSGRLVGADDTRLRAALAAFDQTGELPHLENGVLVEPVFGKPRLVVFGAGHVGARVAEAAAFAGWRVTVADDRADFADARRLPFAERVVTCEFHDVSGAVPLDAETYVVIATRGHQHDVEIAGQLVPRSLRYLGMLGSRRKVAMTAKALRGWGITEEAIANVHAPVGLSIGADTPEEIAVSVVAEMISVRRAGSRRRGGSAVHAGDANDDVQRGAAAKEH
ncbi:MAG TPA: XdhC/CoxI family protein [Gemmatimonadaceae bacterium]|jgi:xanthine dehydrogenase accessory factor